MSCEGQLESKVCEDAKQEAHLELFTPQQEHKQASEALDWNRPQHLASFDISPEATLSCLGDRRKGAHCEWSVE